MDMTKPQQRWPKDVRIMPAGWYPDPWDLSGEAMTERWWNGLIWGDRTRQKKNLPVRDKPDATTGERKTDD